MEIKINWSKQAVEDIYQIQTFLEQTSPRYANAFVDAVFERGELLEKFPMMGRIVPEFNRKFIRELIYKQYRIIYNIVSDTKIDIIAVHNNAIPLSGVSLYE